MKLILVRKFSLELYAEFLLSLHYAEYFIQITYLNMKID